jgi:tetratricopeptide (TPR) repeat protein
MRNRIEMTRSGGWLTVAAGSLLMAGCLTAPAGRIDVPTDILRGRGPNESGSARNRYVVRMTDGDQDWEFQLPEIATAYEVRIPLRGKAGQNGGIPVDQATLTAADKEIVGQREVDARLRAEEPPRGDNGADGTGEGGEPGEGVRPAGLRTGRPNPGAAPAGPTATPRSSYLLTLAKVKDLYRSRNYEIALVELVALEREYPNDERIMSMKGSLYEKLGRRQLARESWEAVLSINPYNLQVAEALQRLGK